MKKQVFLSKVKINQPFYYVRDGKYITGIHLGSGFSIINGKYENMNPKLMVYKGKPSDHK
jgi:hypothetical protein